MGTTTKAAASTLLQTTSHGWQIRRAAKGHLYCSCPSWRFQGGVDPTVRTCKHLNAFAAEQAAAPRPRQLRAGKFLAAHEANQSRWTVAA